MEQPSPYLGSTRAEWSALRAATPLTLNEDDVAELRGINVALSLSEVEDVYLPLSRLLNLYVRATQNLFSVTDTFLGKPTTPVPYVIGVAGSVAVGKSTTARVLQATAEPLARPSPGRPGHHRRISLPQRHPRGAGSDEPQGLPRELRPPAPASVRLRPQVRGRAGGGTGLYPPGLRHRPRGGARR